MTKKSPKVFISHSSADKERFVESFAAKLSAKNRDRQRGFFAVPVPAFRETPLFCRTPIIWHASGLYRVS